MPPNIVDEESSADIAVQEGEDAILMCRATGHPPPRVTWKREDGDFMLLRKPGSRELIKGIVFFTNLQQMLSTLRRQTKRPQFKTFTTSTKTFF